MKQLFVLRHSKSTRDLEVFDIDRPLTNRGIENTYLIADRLLKNNLRPEMIISSTACRASHTAIIMMRMLGVKNSNFIINQAVYEANCNILFDVINSVDKNINKLMIVGHNNTFTDFVNLFLSDKIENLPTTGVVVLSFDTDSWSIKDLKPTSIFIEFPKNDALTNL